MRLRNLFRQILATGKDENFLHLVHYIEKIASKLLAIAMLIVIIVAIVDLGILLFRELFTEPIGFFNTTLIELFGLFLNILIALELLANITAYLEKNVIQVELVIITSLIAVARKLIILDLDKTSGSQLIGLAIAIFALSVSYWIVRRSNTKPS
ncbi:phosphate-starvation-inducible PsiE family protein [Synechocystis sp. PCC 7509]|uniref:phosphate-starvation-inducible PsiE family protein n=1 Tax=Synechocystis sp. PCC 7509 TaxID=927677 RepID=UPI0002ABECC3|nr:phosphate-starvation-inducible PsiE family protein [Synechocystis sp. PCC 7509]